MQKQADNGVKGQSRTEAILADKFWLHWISVDSEGRDVMVEPRKNNLKELRTTKEGIATLGIVQSKFFEGNNEVKIAREYVEDIEGVYTDFFAIIHTGDEDSKRHNYFFTAEEITKQFKLRSDKKGKQYYIFSLTKNRTFSSNKDLTPDHINSIISDLISKTDEYRNQAFIRKIESKFIDPGNRYQHNDTELWKSVEGMHIVDKLLTLLCTYSGFRHVLAWRQTEKISFSDRINTHTYYQNFTLKTNNSQIISFFENIDIGKEAVIKSKPFFANIKNANAKVKKIVQLLNASNIYTFDNYKDKVNINIVEDSECECGICALEKLNFFRASKIVDDVSSSSDCWDQLAKGFVLFELGKYQNAIDKVINLPESLIKTKDFVPSFIASYNLDILRQYVVEEKKVNLYYELLKLPINTENRDILRSVSDRTLLNDYLKTVDDLYLKIKDYKQRRNNVSTLDYLNRQRVKLIECLSFFKENRILVIDEFKVLCEKHIECCIISYSMQTPYRNHLSTFDDFIIKIALLYCDSINLLGYFQRNSVDSVIYDAGSSGYLNEALDNFFCDDNILFLNKEIVYVDNITGNPDLRRKTIRIFNNICILLSYVEIEIRHYIPKIINFISKLDFTVDEISSIAQSLLRKPDQVNSDVIYTLMRHIAAKDDTQGYLLSNCLYCLEIKQTLMEDSEDDLVNSVIGIAVNNPEYGTLRPLSKVVNGKQINRLKQVVSESLTANFDQDLYHQSVKNRCIDQPLIFFEQYCSEIEKVLSRRNIIFSENNSAYTGISRFMIEKVNNFIECIYILDKKELFDLELLQRISALNDYFKFLLNIDTFVSGHKFNINWLFDISSETLLKRMNENQDLRAIIKHEILNIHNKYLLQIYFKYFQ